MPLALAQAADVPAPQDTFGFTRLFDGKTLDGWKLVGGVGPGYVPQDGILDCPADGGGNLFTEKEYSDFVFRFEFKLSAAGNNGIGIRAPLQGDAAYMGMELPSARRLRPLTTPIWKPGQYHSSIYKVVAGQARLTESGRASGIRKKSRRSAATSRSSVNGMVTVDANLNDVSDPRHLRRASRLSPRDVAMSAFLGTAPAMPSSAISLSKT